jgi:hypothetical protein
MRQMLDSSPYLWHKIRRKLCGRHRKSYFEADKLFHPEIFTWDDIYLEGYWQTEKYFESVAEQVKEAYDVDRMIQNIMQSKNPAAGENLTAVTGAAGSTGTVANSSFDTYLRDITHTDSVSVHIRRGDYLTPENQALFGGICTEDYYRSAMERMRYKHPDCRFYLFTNDKEWAGRIAGGSAEHSSFPGGMPDVTLVELSEGKAKDYAEFALMSKCRHNILANSSFSWWASYLNQNPEKTVFAPDGWLNGWDCRDIYRTDMEKVGRNIIHE